MVLLGFIFCLMAVPVFFLIANSVLAWLGKGLIRAILRISYRSWGPVYGVVTMLSMMGSCRMTDWLGKTFLIRPSVFMLAIPCFLWWAINFSLRKDQTVAEITSKGLGNWKPKPGQNEDTNRQIRRQTAESFVWSFLNGLAVGIVISLFIQSRVAAFLW